MEARWYEIRVQGILGEDWADWFDGMSMRAGEDGSTILAGPMPDQSALHGCLAKLSTLNLTLVSVNPVNRSALGPHDAKHKE